MCAPAECWPIVAQVERQAELMERMMQVLGVNEAAAARSDRGEAFARARTVCLNCTASRECEVWLDAARRVVCAPSFCPNAIFFAEFMPAAIEGRHCRKFAR